MAETAAHAAVVATGVTSATGVEAGRIERGFPADGLAAIVALPFGGTCGVASPAAGRVSDAALGIVDFAPVTGAATTRALDPVAEAVAALVAEFTAETAAGAPGAATDGAVDWTVAVIEYAGAAIANIASKKLRFI